ncbi:hypothetical protein D018_4122B, partial [Vibrio parahaemolyticus VP2007-007]
TPHLAPKTPLQIASSACCAKRHRAKPQRCFVILCLHAVDHLLECPLR